MVIQRSFRKSLAKLREFRRMRRIVLIQSLVRMKIQAKRYQEKLAENEEYKRKKRIEEARRRVIMQKKMKEAVRTIERIRYRILHLRELRLVRQLLKRLPYECRGVYFKFMEVKRSSNELMNSFTSFLDNNQQMAMTLKYAE